MDRFLIADNPMSDNGNTAVIHTIDPIAIIECIEDHAEYSTPYRHYQYINSDGVPELWTLRVHHLMTTEFDSEQHDLIIDKLLKRTWHWYKSYMEWEDQNIDEDEQAKNN